MKAYLVSWIVGEDIFTHKIFLSEEKAKKYVEHMDETTEFGWITEELEVEE
ncbi:hypothetical protein V7111_07265 [Neobacillus niacini]|uniref:hypothetical protein n=1 Tax=Neobacillus niacini TaxID=86668 RepID=UPI002FFDC30F